MKILVTGATGFVGQYLTERLTQDNTDFIACSRRLLALQPNNYIVMPDFNDEAGWHNLLLGCDAVIHLAARVHVIKEKADDALAEFYKVNVQSTQSLAEAAAKAGVKRFVFVSSIKVNGEFTESQPFSENDTPQPKDAYAISKWQAEKALRKIEKETGMEVVILRPPLIYGAGVKANFASLLKLVDKALPLPFGSINNKRSLIYLGNFVDAIVTCAKHPNAGGQTFLVSDREIVSMSELVKKIAFALNRPSYIFPLPLANMRFFAKMVGKTTSLNRLTQSLVVDSTKIHKALSWQPPFTMEQGLKITADAYRKLSNSEQV